MNEEADYLFAMEMQKRLDAEAVNNESDDDIAEVKDVSFKLPRAAVSKYYSNQDDDYLNRTQNLVHPQWETLDPTPDIFVMFARFDGKFFQSRLKCVTLEWSKRMYSCAGICYQRRNRFGMDVTIRLSEPLLKLRSRKDLVETMLHEMIHAYCFVLNIREGNGGHGPNFKKIMGAINKVAGTNITVYHTFYDEVNLYKGHWWRCNGICQDRAPFFGYVKRTSNRAPGPNDQWWEQHMKTCSGMFMKIKEPEKKPKPEKQTTPSIIAKAGASTADLRKYFSPVNTSPLSKQQGGVQILSKKAGFQGPIKVNGGGTMLLNPKVKPPSKEMSTKPISDIASAFPPTSYPGLSTDPFNLTNSTIPKTKTAQSVRAPLCGGGNLNNVVSLRDLESGVDVGSSGTLDRAIPNTSSIANMSGRGYTLDKPHNSEAVRNSSLASGQVDRNHLRDIWSKRFSGSGKSKANENEPPDTESVSKRQRISTDQKSNNAEIAFEANNNSFEDDDVIIIAEDANAVIELLSDSDDEGGFVAPVPTRKKTLTTAERQQVIKQEILDDTIGLCDEDIVLIDDDYDDNVVAAAELADTSVIDEFFGEDVLLSEFQRENDVVPSGSRYHKDPKNDIISCPICMAKMKRSVLEEHLNGCMGIAIKLSPPKRLPKNTREVTTRRKQSSKKSKRELLRKAGYSKADLTGLDYSESSDELNNSLALSDSSQSSTSSYETDRQRRQRNFYTTMRQCPCCGQNFEKTQLFDHMDDCPGKS